MSRRFFSLAAVVAITAFAGMAATAQAEPHFYKNGKVLPAESGTSLSEGTQIISWGKLLLETKSIGNLSCFNEFGGRAWNPGGAEGPAAEGHIESYAVYDCTNELCEVGLKSKIEIIPSGLSKFGFWEARLFEEAGVIKMKAGNKEAGSPSQIHFLISCPEGPEKLGKLAVDSRGELTPNLKSGTALSSPGKIEFLGASSGELELAGIPEGKVKGNLKAMGYEGNEVLAVKNP